MNQRQIKSVNERRTIGRHRRDFVWPELCPGRRGVVNLPLSDFIVINLPKINHEKWSFIHSKRKSRMIERWLIIERVCGGKRMFYVEKLHAMFIEIELNVIIRDRQRVTREKISHKLTKPSTSGWNYKANVRISDNRWLQILLGWFSDCGSDLNCLPQCLQLTAWLEEVWT